MKASVIAQVRVKTPTATIEVWKEESGDLSLRITGLFLNWFGRIELSGSGTIEPGPEHAWVRTRVCEALYTAMGRYGLDEYTRTLITTSPGWYEICKMANAELGGGRVLE
jgi:hypothetical protein